MGMTEILGDAKYDLAFIGLMRHPLPCLVIQPQQLAAVAQQLLALAGQHHAATNPLDKW